MNKFILATVVLLASPAFGQSPDIIDYVLKFADEATSLHAAQVGGFLNDDGTWNGAQVIAPISVWQTTAIAADGTETRNVQAGYWMLVSTVGRNATIEGCGCLQMAADRDVAATGAPVATWLLINNTAITPAMLGRVALPTWHVEPMFAGSQLVYKIGGSR